MNNIALSKATSPTTPNGVALSLRRMSNLDGPRNHCILQESCFLTYGIIADRLWRRKLC